MHNLPPRTVRTAMVADSVWESLQLMAAETGAEMDALVNLALLAFARRNGYAPSALLAKIPPKASAHAKAQDEERMVSGSIQLAQTPPEPEAGEESGKLPESFVQEQLLAQAALSAANREFPSGLHPSFQEEAKSTPLPSDEQTQRPHLEAESAGTEQNAPSEPPPLTVDDWNAALLQPPSPDFGQEDSEGAAADFLSELPDSASAPFHSPEPANSPEPGLNDPEADLRTNLRTDPRADEFVDGDEFTGDEESQLEGLEELQDFEEIESFQELEVQELQEFEDVQKLEDFQKLEDAQEIEDVEEIQDLQKTQDAQEIHKVEELEPVAPEEPGGFEAPNIAQSAGELALEMAGEGQQALADGDMDVSEDSLEDALDEFSRDFPQDSPEDFSESSSEVFSENLSESASESASESCAESASANWQLEDLQEAEGLDFSKKLAWAGMQARAEQQGPDSESDSASDSQSEPEPWSVQEAKFVHELGRDRSSDSASDSASEPEFESSSEPEIESQFVSEFEPDYESEYESEFNVESARSSESAESEVEPVPLSAIEYESAAESEFISEFKPDSASDPGSDPASDSDSDSTSAPTAEADANRPILSLELRDRGTVEVGKSHFLLGRGKNCDLVFPVSKVSREHAAITFDGVSWFIKDLGSSNGTWHQQRKVEKQKIQDGDKFFISTEPIICRLGSAR